MTGFYAGLLRLLLTLQLRKMKKTPLNSSEPPWESCGFWEIFLKLPQVYFHLVKDNDVMSLGCANLLVVFPCMDIRGSLVFQGATTIVSLFLLVT